MEIDRNVLLVTIAALCSFTLLYSFVILKRLKKIMQLTSSIYDDLAAKSYMEPKLEINQDERITFLEIEGNDALAEDESPRSMKENYSVFDKEDIQSIQLLESTQEIPNRQITRAEAYMTKILQARK